MNPGSGTAWGDGAQEDGEREAPPSEPPEAPAPARPPGDRAGREGDGPPADDPGAAPHLPRPRHAPPAPPALQAAGPDAWGHRTTGVTRTGRRRVVDALRTRTAFLRGPRRDPYWLAVALFVAWTVLSVGRYRSFSTISWDLGIFEQAVRGYAHLHAPVADLKGPGTNLLGDHFSPVLALLAPFYRLLPSPVTLLTAQAALFAWSVVPVTRASTHLLGRRRGLALGLAYGLSWGLQRAVDFDFHEVAFALPLLAHSLEAVVRRRWTAAALWAAPLVLVKEDLGVTAAAVGAVVLVRSRQAVPSAIALVAFGLTATAVTLGVVVPAFNTAGSYDYWSKLGGTGPSAAGIGLGTAVRTLLWTLLPTSGLLALRSPLLLVALPTLGWRFLGHDPHYWGTDWHYSAVLMPVVVLALADALPRAHLSRRPWLRAYAAHLPAAVAAAALALTTTLPLARLTEAAAYRVPEGAKAAARLLERVPDGATVESDIRPISHLTGRTRVFWIGATGDLAPDYVTVETHLGLSTEQAARDAERRHPGTHYEVLGAAGGVLVLDRQPGPDGGQAPGRGQDGGRGQGD